MHEAKHIEVKHLSDGAVSVRTGCCGDKLSESCTTIYVGRDTTEAFLKAHLDDHADKVAKQHESTLSCLQIVRRITGL